MNEEMQIIREVNKQAERFYEDAVSLGDHAAHVLGGSEYDTHRAQLTGLENIAESTFKRSDVFDYIKKQTAKKTTGWRQPDPEAEDPTTGFGDRLRDHLEQKLPKRVDDICTRLKIGNTTDEEQQKRRRIHLLLIRQFLRQMVVEYEYRVSFDPKPKEQ